MRYQFEYRTFRVNELSVKPKIKEDSTDKASGHRVDRLQLDGESLQPTRRFWKSFAMRFGVAEQIFRYFEPEEVFERISERNINDRLRVCIQRDRDGEGDLLAVTNPQKPVIHAHEAMGLLNRFEGTDVDYVEGVVTSTHVPRSGDRYFDIGGDEFQNRFVLETPIDGFGSPRLHLSLLRTVCTNGAVGYSPAFRSMIGSGKNMNYMVERVLGSFDNGDGYAALRQRFESAQRSWASMRECHSFYQLMSKLEGMKGFTGQEAFKRFYEVTGNLNALYGLANLDALSQKRQRVLPAKCRVYDLINFASELATHHANLTANRLIQAFIGELISDEYDLEGTAEVAAEFKDLFLSSSESSRENKKAPSLN